MPKVTLREKPIGQGKLSLYLDFYPPLPHPQTGKPSRREFLRLYLYASPQDQLERRHNKTTRAQAVSLCAERQLAIQEQRYNFLIDKKRHVNFLHYLQHLAQSKAPSQSVASAALWRNMLARLKTFTGGKIPLEQVNKHFCEAFKNFLSTAPRQGGTKPLSASAAQAYFATFKTALKLAYEQGLLPNNPAGKVSGISVSAPARAFLTLEELHSLQATPCQEALLSRAALFSALTGLRYTDLQQLTWQQVHYSKAVGYYLRFKQQKTGQQETMPIASAAHAMLGQASKGPVFAGLPRRLTYHHNRRLQAWVAAAGIEKKITFHCFRHTFATLQLTLGVDIYTVSKLLGHRSLSATQIYGRIIDTKKKAAAEQLGTAWEEAHR